MLTTPLSAFLTLYVCPAIVAFFGGIFEEWSSGEDTTLGFLGQALLASLIPVINLVFALAYVGGYIWEKVEKMNLSDIVVIRGRKK